MTTNDIVQRAEAQLGKDPVTRSPFLMGSLVAELLAALKAARADLDQAVKDWGENDEHMLAENARLADALQSARAENERLRNRLLIDQDTGRYRCCGTDGLSTDPFHATGCPLFL